MAEIKFLNRLEQVLTPQQLIKIETAALLTRRYTAVHFKIKSVDKALKILEVETWQNRSFVDRYMQNEAELIQRARKFFNDYLQDYTINVTAFPYETPITDVVSAQWLQDHMHIHELSARQLAKQLELPESNISAWANGLRPMSQPVKGLFYYYFEYRKLQSAIKKQ